MRLSAVTEGTGMRPWRGISEPGRSLVVLAAVAGAQLLSVWVGLLLIVRPQGNATIWPSAGVLVAILLLVRRGLWMPALIIAGIVEGLLNVTLGGYGFVMSVEFAVVNVLQALLIAVVVQHADRSGALTDAVRRFVGFAALSGIVLALTALAGAAIIHMGYDASFWRAWRLWWMSDFIGILIGAPLLLTWASLDSIRGTRAQLIEAGVLALGIILSTVMIFGSATTSSSLVLSLLYVTFPFLIWAALRFGPAGVSTTLLVVSTVAVWYTANGYGPMSTVGDTVDLQVAYLQIYFIVATLSATILALTVDEQHSTASALRTQTERLGMIFDHIPVAIVLHDGRGHMLTVNSQFEDATGWNVETLREVDMLEEFFSSAEEREAALKHMGGEYSPWQLFRVRTRDGRIRQMSWASVRLSDGTSIGIGQDVTEQREMEEQLRHSQKMEAVGRLGGRIAHDFNNLLTVILGYTKMSLDHLNPNAEIRENLEQTRIATERAAALTQQLLVFSRKQVRQPRVMDLNKVVLGMDGMIRRLIGSDVVLKTRIDSGTGCIKADPSQIEQGLMNLVVNARDAMPNGGELTIETGEIDLTGPGAEPVAGLTPAQYVRLSVSDTGCGMDETVRSRIFEPFFTTKGPGKGTGLGLATVYSMVRQEGGAIAVDSQPDRGTTFRIYLPVVEEPAAVEAPADRRTGGRGSETILLVEDEEMVRSMICSMLRQAGYTILEADRPSEALRICRTHEAEIHLLLTDVVMPEMNGRELAETIRKIRPLDVLYMSGNTDAAIGKDGILPADVHLIEKPFTEAVLIEKVRSYLDSRRAPVDVPDHKAHA